MSGREWTMQGADFVTGDMRGGPGARVGRRFTGSGLWFVAAWGRGRTLQEEGVPDSAEAKAIASTWLDARAGTARSGPTSGDPKAARRVVLDVHRRMTAALDAARDAALEEWLAALEEPAAKLEPKPGRAVEVACPTCLAHEGVPCYSDATMRALAQPIHPSRALAFAAAHESEGS